MSERETLIELLKESKCNNDCDGFTNAEICKECKAYEEHAKSADCLLENGVIAPPVKIGQTVYGISRGVIVPIIVDKIIYSNDGIDFLGRNEQYFGRSFIHIDINNGFGIEWYKSKEEAEKALKGGAE